jgi:hypothetical protein
LLLIGKPNRKRLSGSLLTREPVPEAISLATATMGVLMKGVGNSVEAKPQLHAVIKAVAATVLAMDSDQWCASKRVDNVDALGRQGAKACAHPMDITATMR